MKSRVTVKALDHYVSQGRGNETPLRKADISLRNIEAPLRQAEVQRPASPKVVAVNTSASGAVHNV